MATLQYAIAVVGLLTAAACSGNLPLRYGETLCDPQHPCPGGQVCADSICVPDTRPDQDVVVTTDEFEGDWDNPFPDNGDTIVIPSDFCRSDEQCGNGEACRDGVCKRTPCFGVACGAGDVCDFQCIPTSAACDGVRCVDNFEHCVDGDCVPSCDIDPCDDPGCDPVSDPNCVAGDCKNGTLCFGGVCREITPCGDDGNAFCGTGFLCSLGCSTPSLCDSISCNPGWSCVITTDGMGIQTPTCIGSPCSGLSCGAGESCIGGECIDTCQFVPCEDGGRQCAAAGAVCCNGTCCNTGEVCRVVREDQPGVCLRPEGVCDPACSADEICVQGECLCAEYPAPRDCNGLECCRTKTCDNPCDPNPCASNPGNPLCTVDCTTTEGYRCVNDCGGVTCPLLNTVCNPASGQCLCGSPGSQCTGGQCCIDNDGTGPGTTYVCDDTCNPNPCTAAAYGDNRRCVSDCTKAEGFSCVNYCQNVTCGPNMACDVTDGICKCGTDGACNSPQCCVNDAGTLDCRNPCSPNPCGGSQCTISCTSPGGYTCTNNCAAGACSTDVRNPDCNPAVPPTSPPPSAQCQCQSDANGTFATCNGSQCCNDIGTCGNPCAPNPCPTGGNTANQTRCTANCRTSGNDFDCTDPCSPNNCGPNTTQQNPDCQPTAGGNAQCTCFAQGSPCGAGTCCEPGGCQAPCSPNRCPDDAGSPNDDNPAFTRCVVRCDDSNNYTCQNPCAGNSCGTQNEGRNPQCHSVNAGQDQQCWCEAAGQQCGAGTCCQGASCNNPCAGNPCGTTGICQVHCNQPGGFTCNPLCTGASCANQASGQNPICDPDDTNHAATNGCECVGDAVCTGNQCCVDSNNDGTREGCADPCAGNPCGGSGVCVRDCRQARGYTCNDTCSGITCPNQNPQCDPTDTNPATRCGCGTDTCVGNECCVSNLCDDACNPDPCTSGTNTRCINDCSQPAGFRCDDPCSGNNCAGQQPGFNPQCRSSGATGDSAQCYCASANNVCGGGQCCDKRGVTGCANPCAGNPCGSTGACVADCAQTNGYRCDPVACAPACVSPLTCDLSTGHCKCNTTDATAISCGAPAQPAATYPQACCDVPPGGPVDLQCISRACISNAQCRGVAGASNNCICDPCTGCSAPSGESGNCPPIP